VPGGVSVVAEEDYRAFVEKCRIPAKGEKSD
jgi:hypothetical protein